MTAPSLKLQALAFVIKDLPWCTAKVLWEDLGDIDITVLIEVHKQPGVSDHIKEQFRAEGKSKQEEIRENPFVISVQQTGCNGFVQPNVHFKNLREAFWWLYTSCSANSLNTYYDVHQRGLPALGKKFSISRRDADQGPDVFACSGFFAVTDCGQGIRPVINKKNQDIDPKTFVGLN